MEHFPILIGIATRFPEVDISVGAHPTEHVSHEPTVEELVALAQDPKVVAIGETGLDYHDPRTDRAQQQERFRCHIRAARVMVIPLIIHTRDARADTLRILREEDAREVGGMMHCFTEDWPTARSALDLGFYISFSGIITFRNAADLRKIAAQVPLDRLLIETDAPYLAPAPHRGKPNHPALIRYVAEHLAHLRNMDVTALAEATTINFLRLTRV